MPGTPTARKHSPPWRSVAILVLLGLLLYIVLPQLHEFRHASQALRRAGYEDILLAVLMSFGAHTMAAAKYNALAFKPLRYGRTLLVQLAGLLTNRLLPIGIGGIGINYLYLRKERHSASQAAAVLTMNNLLGLIGHALLVLVLVLVARVPIAHLPHFSTTSIVTGLFALVLAMLFVVALRRRVQAGLRSLVLSLLTYRTRPRALLATVLYSVAIAAFYAASLWYSARALHIPIAYVTALIVLTVGVAAATITPTPGGLLGVEAALVAGLVAYHVSAADALAVALLYRLITYWFSLLLGTGALIVCERKALI